MSKVLRLAGALGFYAALIYASLLLFAINYLGIVPGLDASWAYALNLYAHGPEIFGKDIVLTYGPLAYLAVPQNVGSNIQIAAVVHILFWGTLIYLLLLIHESGQRFGALILTAALIVTNKLYFFYWDYQLSALMIVVFVLLLIKPDSAAFLVILSLCIGTAFLVKVSGYVLGMLLLGIYAGSRIRVIREGHLRERILLCAAFASGPIAYLIYNPSLSGLFGYIHGSLDMSSGYSTTMSLPTEPAMLMKAALFGGTLATVAFICWWKDWVSTAGVLMVVTTTWVAFKHGYVRSESQHAAVFFCFGIIAVAFLLAQMRYTALRAALFGVLFAVFGIAGLQETKYRWPVWSEFWWTPDRNLQQAIELLNRTKLDATLKSATDSGFTGSVIDDYTLTLRNSRVIFFPWDVAYGARGHFTTVPLFGTQAYTTYTEFLDRQSALGIENASPPIDYVLFEWKSIDSRNPLLDVPAIWNALFSRFRVASSQADSILLQRRAAPLTIEFKNFQKAACPLQSWIGLPQRSTPVGLSLDLHPTAAGSVVSALYQIGKVNLEVRTRSGRTIAIRIPPAVVSSPFPINSLPLDQATLETLWKENLVTDPIVAFRLTGPGLAYIHCRGLQFYDVTGTGIRVPIT